MSDATFEALRKHFDERQIAEPTVINAIENSYDLIDVPLGIEADAPCALARAR